MSLFIGNIANEVSKKELEDLFSKYGKCEINYKGAFAFAEYSLDKEAEQAKVELDKKEINGRSLSIEWSKKSKNYIGSKRYEEISPRGKCYICGRSGHFARDCPEGRRSNSRRHYHSKRRYRSHSRSHRHHHRSRRRYKSSRSSSRRSPRKRYRKRSYNRRSRSRSYYRKSKSRRSRKSYESENSRNYDNKSLSKKSRSRSNKSIDESLNNSFNEEKNYYNNENNDIK